MRAIPLAAALAGVTAAFALTACGGDGGGGDANAKSDASGKSSACSLQQVGVDVGPANAAPAAGDTGNIPVTVTNTGSGACTLDGFPGVDLRADGTSWTLAPEEGAKAQKVTLHQDEAATFTLTYVRGEAGSGAAVRTLRISLPGHTGDKESKWTYGDVAEKSADKLDATVSTFRTAGD
ncbi:DUF4232 domain-containing protein [Streptomyces sp. NPDC005813]|uniref:DUF4232 domain-containing protein n=1 Tax=Streptomyces sp. NPDC005813 TaxID=3155592 RepID=UPI0033CDEDC9